MNHVSLTDGPMRFLLVEDNTASSIDLECILEELGHSITAVAATPDRARQALQRDQGMIDAAILNADLVGKSSLPVADALRRRGIPCVIASELGDDVLRRLGFEGLTVEKPYRADRVASAVARMRAACGAA